MTVCGSESHTGEMSERAQAMAAQLSEGFKAHDRKDRADAIEAFTFVDYNQFRDLDEQNARHAATAFVDALWEKDKIEFNSLQDGEIDPEAVQNADYGPVRQQLRKRASIIGADPEYATTKAKAWRRHKTGGDYWTPFQRSQVYELRSVLQDPEYPNKSRGGRSGPGPEPLRYVLAFELHNMNTKRHWKQGEQVMQPYFEYILRTITDATD